MTVYTKLPLSVFVTLIALTAFVPMASALRGFSFERQAFTGTDLAALFSTGSGNVACPMTLEGTLHRTIAKVEGTLAGYITRGRIAEASCTDTIEAATVQAELGEGRFPWHQRYEGFYGELPFIDEIAASVVANFTLNVRTIFGTTRCRYPGTTRIFLDATSARVTRILMTGGGLGAQGFPCPNSANWVSILSLTTSLPVTLI